MSGTNRSYAGLIPCYLFGGESAYPLTGSQRRMTFQAAPARSGSLFGEDIAVPNRPSRPAHAESVAEQLERRFREGQTSKDSETMEMF